MIKKGDIIDIIFPATCPDKKELLEIKNYLTKQGFKPRILLEDQFVIEKKISCYLPLNSAALRFKQLYMALKDDKSTAIWCARGGYGSGDLLPFLQKSKKIKQNKIFIGFSDITSIANFLQQKWHWQIITAPMLTQMIDGGKLKVNQKSQKELWNLLNGKKSDFSYQLEPLNTIKSKAIKAEITGGCLSVLCGHLGGKFQINWANKILFLEDIDENGEKLDRYFRQIIEAISHKSKAPKAILLGEFAYGIKDTNSRKNINLAIENLVKKIEHFDLKIPIFKAKEALGHSDKMQPLILGKKMQINQDSSLRSL